MSTIIDAYFKDIRKSKPLTKDSEIELARKVQAGDENALNKLISANLRFVVTIARQYQGRGLELEDLIAEGNIGLIEAAKRFDPDAGYRFLSYAVFWIRQAISTAINNNKLVRLPVNKINAAIAVSKVTNRYMDIEGRKPTDAELSKEIGISVEDVRTILRANQQALDLDMKLGDDDDASTLEAIIADPSAKWADECTNNEGLQKSLLSLLTAVLSEREVIIIVKSFGIDEAETPDEIIAEELGVSPERVRQLKLNALHKLRHCTNPEIMEELKGYLG